MSTSVNINKYSKLQQETQEELAEYGLMRDKALKGAAPKKDGDNWANANYFGIDRYGTGEDTKFKFDASIKEIDDANMELATVAPDDVTFDMLSTTDLQEGLKGKSEESIRGFLRRLFDRV